MDVLFLLQKLDLILIEANQAFLNNLVVLLFCVSAILHRKNSNALFVSAIIISLSVLDILFIHDFLMSDFLPSFSIYLVYLVFDLTVALLLLYRSTVLESIARLKLKIASFFYAGQRTQSFFYERHINEYKIMIVFVLSALYNVFMSAEYPYRWYVNENAFYIYYLYTPFKLILNVLVVYWLFTIKSSNNKKTRSC